MPPIFTIPNAVGAGAAGLALALVVNPMVASNSGTVKVLATIATIMVAFPLGHHYSPKKG
jgi:hypothetical protein